jgi:hypothetical protein
VGNVKHVVSIQKEAIGVGQKEQKETFHEK